jgi:hypothetical protein
VQSEVHQELIPRVPPDDAPQRVLPAPCCGSAVGPLQPEGCAGNACVRSDGLCGKKAAESHGQMAGNMCASGENGRAVFG